MQTRRAVRRFHPMHQPCDHPQLQLPTPGKRTRPRAQLSRGAGATQRFWGPRLVIRPLMRTLRVAATIVARSRPTCCCAAAATRRTTAPPSASTGPGVLLLLVLFSFCQLIWFLDFQAGPQESVPRRAEAAQSSARRRSSS